MRYLRLLAAVLLLSLVVATPSLAASHSDVGPRALPKCTEWMDSPHFSSGAGGAISKGRFKCDSGVAQTYKDVIMYLYLCTSKPPTDSEDQWWLYGCVPKKSATYSSVFAGSGQTVTRYVPPSGQAGAHGSGWWVSCMTYTKGSSRILKISPPREFGA